MEKLVKIFDQLEIKEIPHNFNSPKEIIQLLEHVLNSSNEYFSTSTKYKKIHKLLIQFSSTTNLTSEETELKDEFISKLVEDNFVFLKKVYYEENTQLDHSKDLMIINYLIKLIDSSSFDLKRKSDYIQTLKTKSIKLLSSYSQSLIKKIDSSLDQVHFNFIFWYLLINQYPQNLNLNDYESVIPLLMKFGWLLNYENDFNLDNSNITNEKIIEFIKIYRLIFVKLSTMNNKLSSRNNLTPINDLIYDQIETFTIMYEEEPSLFDNNNKINEPSVSWKQLIGFFKNYQLIVQLFPKPFSVMIFQSEMFLTFLNDKVEKLIQVLNKNLRFNQSINSLILNIVTVFESVTIDEGCIMLIIKNYMSIILQLSSISITNSTVYIVVLANLLIVKCWNSYQQLKLNDLRQHKDENQPKIQEINEEETRLPENLDLEFFYSIFVQCLLDKSYMGKKHIENYCIEGLALISLKVKFKKVIRENTPLIERLSKVLDQQIESLTKFTGNDDVDNDNSNNILSSETVFGIILILSNITTFNLKLSKDEESLEYLKNYSNSNAILNNDEEIKNEKLGVQEKDNDEEILRFLKKIFIAKNLSIISCFSKVFKILTENIQDQIVRLIYNISHSKLFRVELVKQGGLNLIIEYLISDQQRFLQKYKEANKKISNKSSINYENYMRLFGLRASAKILLSNNPNLIFKKYSVLTVIPFLAELLDHESNYIKLDSITKTPDDPKEIIGKFICGLLKPIDNLEGILSLTNIASIEDMKVKEFIIDKTWKFIDNYIFDSNNLIQKSTLELISNLITCPICTSKFFNFENPESRKRLEFIIKLINSYDIKIQISAITIIVNASEYKMVAQSLFDNNELFQKLIGISNSIDEYVETEEEDHVNELLLRVVYLLLNIVESVKDDDTKLEKIKQYNFDNGKTLKTGVEKVLRHIKDEDVLAMIIEVCKSLKYI